MITGSTYNKDDDSFLLSGYTSSGSPFLIHVKINGISNDDIFSGIIEKTDINSSISASQIEGITLISDQKYFLSREKVVIPNFVLNQKLYRFDNGSFSALNIKEYNTSRIKTFPNPTQEILFVNGINIKQISVIDINGKTLLDQKKSSNQILIKELITGTYILKIVSTNDTIITKSFIKN